MPQLIGTPERWFRTQKRNFYGFELAEGIKTTPKVLLDWIDAHLDGRSMIIIGPSEHSGYIIGGPMYQGFGMTDEEVASYSARWEDGEGKSIDPRWQCCCFPYESWLKKIDALEVHAGPPPEGTSCRWLLCERGLYWIDQQSAVSRKASRPDDFVYPGEPSFDDWFTVCQKFPDLLIPEGEDFLMGNYFVYEGQRNVSLEHYRREDGDITYGKLVYGDEPRQAEALRVRAALNLPADAILDQDGFL